MFRVLQIMHGKTLFRLRPDVQDFLVVIPPENRLNSTNGIIRDPLLPFPR